MKNIILFLLTVSLCRTALCMNSDYNGLSWSDDDSLDMVEIKPERWQEFKELDAEAKMSSPSYADESEDADESYQTLLSDSLNNQGRYVMFAQKNRTLIGMAGATIEDAQGHVALIRADFASKRLEKLLGHTQLIESLLEKVKRSGALYAQVQLPLRKPDVISFYEQLGFTKILFEDDEVLMQKNLQEKGLNDVL